MRTESITKADLIKGVKKCKEMLKNNGIKSPKAKFFDEYYKKSSYADFVRFDNLWACKITDKSFTELLNVFVWKEVRNLQGNKKQTY